MKVAQLVRYPVKGLGPEYLECVEVEKGRSIPYDRVFAIAHGATKFDAGSPAYLRKQHFLMLMSNPQPADWYNGKIYGTETMRGLDVLVLVPSEYLTRSMEA